MLAFTFFGLTFGLTSPGEAKTLTSVPLVETTTGQTIFRFFFTSDAFEIKVVPLNSYTYRLVIVPKVTTPAAPVQEAPKAPEKQSQLLTLEEEVLFNLINQERINRGLPPLELDPALVKTARLKSKDMVENNYFGHYSPTYGSPFEMMQAAGISYRYAGENLAGAPTVERAHALLMQSPGHRANILNPQFTRVGVGVVNGGPYGKMITEHFAG